jgi:hypothetical protein
MIVRQMDHRNDPSRHRTLGYSTAPRHLIRGRFRHEQRLPWRLSHLEWLGTSPARRDRLCWKAMTADRTYLVSFTDLIYALLVGYAISLMHTSLLRSDGPALALEVFAALLVVYDWYGEHLLSTQKKAGVAAILFDFAALLIYFGLLFAAFTRLPVVLLLLAGRGARGLVYNAVLFIKRPNRVDKSKLIAWTISSSLMVLVYVLIYLLAPPLKGYWLFVGGSTVWAGTYAIALAAESLLSNSSV